jgi:hypothetical protein
MEVKEVAFLIKKTDKWPPRKGEWNATVGDKPSVAIGCPECGELIKLDNLEVYPDGFVDPAVLCQGKECHFHHTVKLEGWPQ